MVLVPVPFTEGGDPSRALSRVSLSDRVRDKWEDYTLQRAAVKLAGRYNLGALLGGGGHPSGEGFPLQPSLDEFRGEADGLAPSSKGDAESPAGGQRG